MGKNTVQLFYSITTKGMIFDNIKNGSAKSS